MKDNFSEKERFKKMCLERWMVKVKFSKVKKLVIFLSAVLLLILFLRFVVGGPEDSWICVNNQWVKHGGPSSPQPIGVCGATGRPEERSVTLTGIIRSGGLSKEEKTKLGLNFSNYQLTDFNIGQYQAGKVYGYFLESNDPEIKNFEGKCVEVKGKIKEGWGNLQDQRFELNNQYTYNRLAFVHEEVNQKNYADCQIFPDPKPINRTSFKKIEKVSGIVEHALRLAPDISYDYRLRLAKPFIDPLDASGNPKVYPFLDISPLNQTILLELERNMGQKVTVEGEMTWGYAESRYLKVISVKKEE